jgi:hypothetical protein
MFGLGIFTYIKIAVVVALLGAGTYLYLNYHHLKTENALLTRQLAGYKKAIQIMKDDLKTDQRTEDEKSRIDALGPGDLVGEFKRLRKRSRPDNDTESD